MDERDRPNLGLYLYEEIELELHESEKTFWSAISAMQIPTLELMIAATEAQPLPPRQPMHLRAIVHRYAQTLFSVEAKRYPRDSRLHHWMLKLKERIGARIIHGVKELESRGRHKMQRLDYHGVTESQMMQTVNDAIQELINTWPDLGHIQQSPEQSIQEEKENSILEPRESAKPKTNEREIERRRKLLEDYKSATKIFSNRKIYESQNAGIHKPEFYEWIRGTLPSHSKTTKKLERFLREKKQPIPRKPKP